MERELYGVFAAAPKQPVRLHSWPITKEEAENFVGNKEYGLSSDYAKSLGWYSVTMRALTKAEIDEQVYKATHDFGGQGWTWSNLPPTVKQLISEREPKKAERMREEKML